MAGTVTARVGGTILVPDSADPEFLARLRGLMMVANPDADASRRRGRKSSAPDRLCLLDEKTRPGWLSVPRGALAQVESAADRSGTTLRWVSEVVQRSVGRVPIADLGVKPRPYQSEAVERMLARVQLLVQMPCGGGKTKTGAIAVAHSGEPAIAIVPTLDLVEQWVEALREVGVDRVRVPRGSWTTPLRPGEVLVANIQAFNGSEREDSVLHSAGALVLDECHHAASRTWASLISRCPARFRWGLTATPERSDGWTMLLPMLVGPLYEGTTIGELLAGGWLQRPRVIPVASGWTPGPELYPVKVRCRWCLRTTIAKPDEIATRTCPGWAKKPCAKPLSLALDLGQEPIDWTAAVGSMAAYTPRNDAVFRLAQAAAQAGRTTLVLVPRVELATVTAARLRAAGISAEEATGKVSKALREERIRALRRGRISVLVATQVADEGLDVPELDCLVSANPGKSRGRALQRIGRTARPGGDVPIVYDITDGGEEAARQWVMRARGYSEEYGAEALVSRAPVSLETALTYLRSGMRTDSGRVRTGR